MSDDLDAFGKRWNKRAKVNVAFEPEAEELSPGSIPLDIPAVDLMLGGGMPLGRTSIFIGEPSSGKTLLAQLVIAAAQKQGGKALFFDIERTYDAKWFALTGVDTSPDKLMVVRPRTLEQTFDMVIDALEKVQPEVIVVDSVSALVPEAMLKAAMEDKDFQGLAARKTTEGIKKCTAYNQATVLIFINQLRVTMGVVYGNPESMPGGKAIRFHASLILRVRRGKWLTDVAQKMGEEEFTSMEESKDSARIGFMLRLRTEKSKVSTPWQSCELKFFFNGTVDPLGSLIHLAIQRGVIVPTGSYYKVLDLPEKIHGLGRVEKLIREDDTLKNELVRKIKED